MTDVDGGTAAAARGATHPGPAPGDPRREDHAGIEAPPGIGRNERRMHVRAYNLWVAMLGGRQFPAIADLDPAHAGDFSAHGVLMRFGADRHDPAIAWLGAALIAEGGIVAAPRTLADVPASSLLARLTDHCHQVIANRAPIGFEAESVNVRGNMALYRGILLPFSSDGRTVDHVYGVINWKELVDAMTAAEIVASARAALAPPPVAAPAPIAPVWADGPSRGAAPSAGDPPASDPLAERLPGIRQAGSAWQAAEFRLRAALYTALGTAYDLAFAADADPEGYSALLLRAGLRPQPRTPWLPIVKLVFGEALGRGRRADYACVLAHAWRQDVPQGSLRGFLENSADGIRGIVAAERDCRAAE